MVCKCYSIVSFHNFATTFFVFLSPRHTFVPNGYFSPSSPPPLPSPSFPSLVTFASHFPKFPFPRPDLPLSSSHIFPSPSLFSPISHPFFGLLHLSTSVQFSLSPSVSMLSFCVALAHLSRTVHLCRPYPFVSTCSSSPCLPLTPFRVSHAILAATPSSPATSPSPPTAPFSTTPSR